MPRSTHTPVLLRLMLIGAAPVTLGLWTAPALAQSSSEAGDEFGRTYYIDGAGNWGYGVSKVAEGLRSAGYRGRIVNFHWSPTFNPALDQTIGRNYAKSRGKKLGRDITEYKRQHPRNEVNIIALSAGSGVGMWACEALKPPVKVHNLILLGSSLSSSYDISGAVENIDGGIYVYHSPNDKILRRFVRVVGTIDGKLGSKCAGLVGLHPKYGESDRIHNIAWSAEYEQFGWSGSHTDGTSELFVRNILSLHIILGPGPSARPSAATSRPAE